MSQWVAVHGFEDGENAEEDVLNRPVYELVERTKYLYNQLQDIQGNDLFESVRITDATLVTEGAGAPAAGDIVYLHPDEDKYAKAISDESSTDAFRAADSSFAIGLLISASSGSGTVVLYGKQSLESSGSAWTLSDLLESGETFRNGPYYLSTVESGKLTASPSGPSVFVGTIQEDATNPGYGGFMLLNPHYKDMQEAHQHRAYTLYAQPAGTQELSGSIPTSTHTINGFETEDSGDPTDHIPRLVAFGEWAGTSSAQYTIWLSNSSSASETLGSTSPPTDWADYIHWQSDDPEEGTGVSRIWSYESPIAVGTKGLMVALENPSGADWDDPYTINVGSDTENKRTWIIDVPGQTRGWLANKQRDYFDDHPVSDNGFSFLLMGGPHTASDDRNGDIITVKCAVIWRIAYTGQPADGETLDINSTIFEFDSDSSVSSNNVAVTIGIDADTTYTNLLTAVLAQGISGVDACLDTSAGYFMLGVPTAVTPAGSITNAALTSVATGAGDLSTGTTADFLVYDRDNLCLVPTDAYWDSVAYWTPVELSNGLSIMAVPYDTDGSTATADTAAVGDYWDVDFSNDGVNANFKYSLGMHSAVSQYYPPIPANAAALLDNGIELESYSLFPDDPTYKQGSSTIYWYSNLIDNVPWPRDWVSVDSVGSDIYSHNMLFHFVRMSVGNSGVVTSVSSAPDSPISVTECGTNEVASTGDLELGLELALSEDEADIAGYQVFKTVQGQKLRKGPVVEKVIAGAGVEIVSLGTSSDGQGTVVISSSTNSFAGEFEEVGLENAKHKVIGMFPYVQLLDWETGGSNNMPSGFVAKFRVPHTISSDIDYRVIVYMTVFGEEDIPWVGGGAREYAGIDFTYTVLPDFFPIDGASPDVGGGGEEAWNSLDATTLTEGLMQSGAIRAEIPFGRFDDPQSSSDAAYRSGAGHPIYAAYDPMLIHNNPDEASADETRRTANVLGNPLPSEGALVDWNPESVTGSPEPVVRPGSLVGVRVARAGLISGNDEYTGKLGFINLRWKLVKAT